MAKDDFTNGVWRTVGGRRIFIKDGEDLSTAMKNSGKFGNKKEEVEYSFKGSNEKFQNKIKENINKLKEEYNSPLKEVKDASFNQVMKTGEAGSVTDFGETMTIGQATEQTIYHEFAHTLADDYRVKTLGENKEFWNEVKSIEKKYYKEERQIDAKSISSLKDYDPNFNRLEALEKIKIGEHGYYKENTDEFFAESFANYKLGLTKSPYAKQIVELTDKYFKKK